MRRFMQLISQDLRYGARVFWNQPFYALVSLVTLALGIGANTATFTVVNAVLLQPLPYAHPDRLVAVKNTYRDWQSVELMGDLGVSPGGSLPNYLDWRAQNTVFADLAAYFTAEHTRLTLTGVEVPERLTTLEVTASFFPVLGIKPFLGRFFVPEDEEPGNSPVVVLSHGFWQRQFGANPCLIGNKLMLREESFEVIGVAPPDFRFLDLKTDLWLPVVLGLDGHQRASRYFNFIGRLKDGVSLTLAQAEMETIAKRLEATHPVNRGSSIRLVPLHEEVVGQVAYELWLLLGMAGLVLLVTCANIASFVSSMYLTRESEFAIRTSLGATPGILIRQLLTENLLLAVFGGSVGVTIAVVGTKLLIPLVPAGLPRRDEIGVDPWVLGFALCVSLITVLCFGLIPSLRATKDGLAARVVQGCGRLGRPASRRRYFQQTLVTVEIALTLTLFIAAGLLVNSYARLTIVQPGFVGSDLLTFRIFAYGPARRRTPELVAFYRETFERLGNLQGVQSVSATTSVPFTDVLSLTYFRFGVEESVEPEKLMAERSVISPGYFRTMGISLLRGRNFTPNDKPDSQRVLIINRTMEHRFWPTVNPIGKEVWLGKAPTPRARKDPYLIIGVVDDVRYRGLNSPVQPRIYQPYTQGGSRALWNMSVVTRVLSPSSEMFSAIRREIAEVDRHVAIYEARSMQDLMYSSLGEPRFRSWLAGFFALLALLLATVGLLALMFRMVKQRTYEIGVRMAVGARRLDIILLLTTRGATLLISGILLGLLGALAVTQMLSSFLFELSPFDPLTFALASSILGFVGLAACYVPSHQAAHWDPAVTLRHD